MAIFRGAEAGGGMQRARQDPFWSASRFVDLEAEVIQARHEAAVLHHVPGADREVHFAVGEIVAVVAGHALDWAGDRKPSGRTRRYKRDGRCG